MSSCPAAAAAAVALPADFSQQLSKFDSGSSTTPGGIAKGLQALDVGASAADSWL
jgi:hypothetical protein